MPLIKHTPDEIHIMSGHYAISVSANNQGYEPALAVSPYSVDYVKGRYVVYCISKPVCSFPSFKQARQAANDLNATCLVA